MNNFSFSYTFESLIYINIYHRRMMRRIEISQGKLALTEGVIGFFQKTVTRFGTGAKIDCPKEYLNKTVYVVVCED